MKILIMGLPGSGKTWLAERLSLKLDATWYNADVIREMNNDWDFSEEGRLRQSIRMASMANLEKARGRTVICDFVCPLPEMRKNFDADFIIFMDTIGEGRYEDTNKVFEKPSEPHLRVQHFMSEEEVDYVVNAISGVHA